MRFTRLLIGLALVQALPLVTAGFTHASDEPDELVPGTIVVIRTGTLVKFVARPPAGGAFDLPDTPANDPVIEGGMLHIFDTAFFELEDTAWDDTYNLPPARAGRGSGVPRAQRASSIRGRRPSLTHVRSS
jgi:hypothetical protein